jgi:hypothetical protein
MSVEEVALGFVQVANEAMCRPIRNLTEVTLKKEKLKKNIIFFDNQLFEIKRERVTTHENTCCHVSVAPGLNTHAQ